MAGIQPRHVRGIGNPAKEFRGRDHGNAALGNVQKVIDRRNFASSAVKGRRGPNQKATGAKTFVLVLVYGAVSDFESVLQEIQHGTRDVHRPPFRRPRQIDRVHERVAPALFGRKGQQALAQPLAGYLLRKFGVAKNRDEIVVGRCFFQRRQRLDPSLPDVFEGQIVNGNGQQGHVFRLFGFFFGRRSCRKAPGDTIAQIAQFVQAVQVGWWPVTMAISVSRGSILRRMKSSACRRRSVVVVGMRMRILMIPFAGAISLPISSSVSITTSAIGGTVAIVAVAIRIIVVVTSSPSVVIVITIVIVVVVVVVVIS
mmetsp:Transcript_2372/g.4289  ORF Transcript_2372/g.4289 Transcript_2372/m.4289 type:complete len:313 (+) Transcript_2372:2723-3661(+)